MASTSSSAPRRFRYGIFIGDVGCSKKVAVKDDPAEAVETARTQLLYHADTATDACVIEASSKQDGRILFWCRIENGALNDLYQIDPQPQQAPPSRRRRR